MAEAVSGNLPPGWHQPMPQPGRGHSSPLTNALHLSSCCSHLFTRLPQGQLLAGSCQATCLTLDLVPSCAAGQSAAAVGTSSKRMRGENNWTSVKFSPKMICLLHPHCACSRALPCHALTCPLLFCLHSTEGHQKPPSHPLVPALAPRTVSSA